MNDDIKRVLSRIYESRTLTEASGAQDAMANLNKDVEVKGSFNAKAFGTMLGMQASEAALLTSFINKHKSGQTPSRMEVLAAADAFRALVDADNQKTNQALMMLRRVHADQTNESIRMTKEGIEECWGDMQAPAAPMNSDETMTVSISMPNKNISVTTDSADEIMNVLKLAGISAMSAPAADSDEDTSGFSQNPEDQPRLVGAKPMVVSMGEDEISEQPNPWAKKEDEESEDKEVAKKMSSAIKKEDVNEDVNEEDIDENAFNQAAAAAARAGKEEFEFPAGSGKMHPVKMDKKTANQMGESNAAQEEMRRILGLAGLDESKLANAPAGTSMDEPAEYGDLPSNPGDGAGHKDFGQNRANNQGENPMGIHTPDFDSLYEAAMAEYRKFVDEKIKNKK